MSMDRIKNPLFRDPIYDGAADPVIVWNQVEKKWWIVYTNRRATVVTPGVEWVHGTDLGIASSEDGGHSWKYEGIMEGLDIEPGRNTFWAPEIIFEDGLYHMFVSYINGVYSTWESERSVLHYTSDNLRDWTYIKRLELSSNNCIDACVHKLPSGKWGLWYKDEANGSHTYLLEGEDLYHLANPREIITDYEHEGPNVFFWKNWYWMIVDTWKGQGVYKSTDCMNWVRGKDILCESGTSADDAGFGLHADVLVQGDEAYIFYFTHPGRFGDKEETDILELQRSSLQMRRLVLIDDELVCNRNEEFAYELKNI